jgi:hypothetical protein
MPLFAAAEAAAIRQSLDAFLRRNALSDFFRREIHESRVGARHRLECCGLKGSEWGEEGGPEGGCESFSRLRRDDSLMIEAMLSQTFVELLSKRYSDRKSVRFFSINQRLR